MSLYGTLPRRRSARLQVPSSTITFFPKSPDSGITLSSHRPFTPSFPSSTSPVSASFSSAASSSGSSTSGSSFASSASSNSSYGSTSRLTLNSFGITSGKTLSRIDSVSTLISSNGTHEYFVPSNLFSSPPPPPPPTLPLRNSSNSPLNSSRISSFTRSTLQTRPLPLPSIQSLNSLHSDSLTEYSPDYAVIQPTQYNPATNNSGLILQRHQTVVHSLRDNSPKIFLEADSVEETTKKNIPNFYGNTEEIYCGKKKCCKKFKKGKRCKKCPGRLKMA